ncbi:hypothetical protein A3I53_03530 [Candidatus Curtissbacteria bacterium RIFCSPLOWO2_02_FULL_40_13b]|uniref:Uncharacterized protein n=2 Tax=Candidatus Curtissiibacteriota TaxID=1752717 RepID=A0A1F5HXU8_9BACT|nr:MAG: hypothetical protein A3F45_01545 [Candidatus Curtissbacteria bacterium RIFCSPHIGHO2_12_FULL_41_17]OGE09012.1 MAG: hypothetical protein A3I53_03530 [Candidatus Curtissbacteria bacterium RIFCSPLOWO2_02_FULL_40_13b]
MPVEAKEKSLTTLPHNGRQLPEFETFDPQDEPLSNIAPGESVPDFHPIRAHQTVDFDPSSHTNPSGEAVLAFNNGRHP